MPRAKDGSKASMVICTTKHQDSKIALDVAFHCEEHSDEAILMEVQGFRDCFASPRLPSGGQVAMASNIASILGNHSTLVEQFECQ